MIEKSRFKPFILSALIIALDQLSKAWVVGHIAENTIGYSFFSDFLWIVHVRNNAVAFSLGEDVPILLKYVFFVALPILIMAFVAYLVASHRGDGELTTFQRWCFAGIFGGGCGNIIDRLFRSLRVVDFISVKFYGLFGMERFPTWNVADSAVVISVILLIISLIVNEVRGKEKKDGRKEKS